jgi:hypothetical protein
MRQTSMKYMLMFVMLAAIGARSPVLIARQPATAPQAGRGAAATDDQPVTPGEVQRLMDAYALMQAQDQLKISDEQFSQFLSRYRALQDIRRKARQEHERLVNEMRRMLNGGGAIDDAALTERLKAIQDLDARSATDLQKAYDAIDHILDVRQQAKFRVFEENMERRMSEFVNRARQANRPKQQ